MDKEKLKDIVERNNTLSGVLKELGIDPASSGSRSRVLKERMKQDQIDFSHMQLGRFHNLGRKFNRQAIPLEEVMIENSTYDRLTLKRRLLKIGLLKNVCYICGQQPEWNNKTLVLIIDHINGKRRDNRLENLRILCPNCNSQTDTFSGRQNKKPRKKCKNCGTEISLVSHSGYCQSCHSKLYNRRKVENRPTKEKLLKEVEETNYTAVGRKYGVSDKTVKKWIML
jgi:Zn finger protein HypA/HybF involved in hydrogenase expression